MATKNGSFHKAVIAEFDEARKEKGVSYRQLSEATGINTGTLSKYLAGNTSVTIQTIYDLCDGLGVDFMTIARKAQERIE